MTSPLVKLVLTLGLCMCCLQGISCLDDRVKKLGKCLAKTKTKLMKADETISQFTTKNCQLLTQQTTKNNEILTHIKRTDETISQLRTQNEKQETMIKELETMIQELVTQNKKSEAKYEKLLSQNEKQETMIKKLETNDEKFLTRTEKLISLQSKKGDTEKLLTSLASKITDTKKAIDDIHNVVIATTCADVNSPYPRPIVTLTAGPTVVCDTTTDNGGWVVFQRRTSGDVDFYRDWQQYKNGFGDKPNNFWLGLEAIHQLTSGADHELRVDMKYKGKNYYAKYDSFRVHGENEKYKLEVSGYTGNAGNDLVYHNDHYFSTWDKDHDPAKHTHCAQRFRGAWWYRQCAKCNLNGMWANPNRKYGQGLTWYDITTDNYMDSVSFSEMKFRPRRP